MSVDLWTRCPTCREENDPDINFTYNYARMWHLATGDKRDKTVDIDGMTGAESLPLLRAAIAYVEDHFSDFVALQPSNGWGTAEHFLSALRRCVEHAVKFPTSRWEASR